MEDIQNDIIVPIPRSKINPDMFVSGRKKIEEETCLGE